MPRLSGLRDTLIGVFHGLAAVILLVIAAVSGLLLEAERNSIFDQARMRAEVFSRRAGAALFPRTDRFSLHFLVNTLMLEKTIKYACVADAGGRILSHSDPELIGDTDRGREGAAARAARVPLTQVYEGSDGLEYYSFSHPVIVGNRRIGTVMLALNSATVSESLAPTKQKIVFIFSGSLAALLLLGQLRALLKAERRSAALKTAMVRTVSHEFNNALTVIDAAAFMLEEGEPKKISEAREELYRTMEAERQALGRYVKNILNEARMEAGRFKPQKTRLALRDLAAGIAGSTEGLVRQKRISFKLEMPEKPLMVLGDREALSLVISNLVGNAVKYTGQGGAIAVRLTAGKGGADVTFACENSGAGLKPEEISRLKEEFYRTEDGKAAASGFGLGLRISNEMLRLHGSELQIRSEPGKTSCFFFTLPALQEQADKPA